MFGNRLGKTHTQTQTGPLLINEAFNILVFQQLINYNYYLEGVSNGLNVNINTLT